MLYKFVFRLLRQALMYFLYWPHYFVYKYGKIKDTIREDVKINAYYNNINCSENIAFFKLMYSNRYFRTLYFFRIGNISRLLWGEREKTFIISADLGPGCYVAHPYATTIYAKKIGRCFTCHQCTTVGVKGDMDNDKRPTIGDNVVLGTNVCIIGDVVIGNNVTIGAGAVVVKNIPDNCIVVGNPARIIGKKETI